MEVGNNDLGWGLLPSQLLLGNSGLGKGEVGGDVCLLVGSHLLSNASNPLCQRRQGKMTVAALPPRQGEGSLDL